MFTIKNNIIEGKLKNSDIKPELIGEKIIEIFNDKPHHVAQIEAETNKVTTYLEMKNNTIRCALWMQKQGVGCNDVVAVCNDNQLDTYIPCFATFLIGATLNPWYHLVNTRAARQCIGLTKPTVIFSCESAIDVLKEAAELEDVDAKIIVFGKYEGLESLEEVMDLQTTEEVKTFKVKSPSDKSDIAMILNTSGTTGLSKGVAHSYESLFENISTFNFIPKQSICLWYSGISWTSGINAVLKALFNDATRIIHQDFDPEETCKVIDRFKIQWFFASTRMFASLSKSNIFQKYKVESLRMLTTVGGKVSRNVLKDLRHHLPHVSVDQIYGMTEIGNFLTTIQTDQCTVIDSVGFVIPNIDLKIINLMNGEILGPYQTGEIFVKSPALMVGYYNNEEATKAVLDKDGWYHTGDLGYYKENGELFIVDRLKEFIRFQEYKFSPFEVEEVLLNHPAVMEVVVVPVPHDVDYEHPLAFVKKVPDMVVTEEELVEFSNVLGDHKKLRAGVQFLDEIPSTSTQKVDRRLLKEMAKSYAQKVSK